LEAVLVEDLDLASVLDRVLGLVPARGRGRRARVGGKLVVAVWM
jgi:hypothetical protein